MDHIKGLIEKFDTKPDPSWLAERIVVLLTHYFVSDINPAALAGVAKDWVHELEEYPDWAILRACRWWISKENKKLRRKKPLPGDIAEQADRQASTLKAWRRQIEVFEKYGDNPPSFLR